MSDDRPATGDITFFRLRPATTVTDMAASTRLAEGTTGLEMDRVDPESTAACVAGGVLPVAVGHTDDDTVAWVVEPGDALELSEAGIPGWRLTVIHSTDRASVVDALARTEAAYLRTGRSRVGEAASICALPSIRARASVFVDSVADAISAIGAGATDLLLRDWDSERIGELREAVGGRLCERVAIPPRIPVNEARESLPASLFKVYLNLVDSGGRARPRYTWPPVCRPNHP